MSRRRPTTSSVGRFVKLGGLMGRVGASVLTERAVDFAMAGPTKQMRRTENLVKNAARIVETLGEMKGAAMKVGQMLSLHEGMLPPEVAEVLRDLQQEAPRVPPEVMRYELEGSLGDKVDALFLEFDEKAYAAASIGQVHKARLHDGRRVAVKIQYPLIDEIVRADLKNLKRLLGSIFALFSDGDFEPLWAEVRDHLLEELDYEHEAQNMKKTAELYADVPEVLIPTVVDELSTKHVLTMEYLYGIRPEEACSERFSQELKNRWGQVLFDFQMRGLFQLRWLHADPNLANFAFREDGRVIVYDFGCIKRVPALMSDGYAALVRAVIDDRREAIPALLKAIGVYKTSGDPLPREICDSYVDLFGEIVHQQPYVFGEDQEMYRKIMDLGAANWSEATDVYFPQDIIFIDRTLAGHFGNLNRLRAAGPWRDLLEKYV
jgi:predicted unusual protein kinase regulating ubiquinone biosynthesis (AarF/ABC1/UbiB family)